MSVTVHSLLTLPATSIAVVMDVENRIAELVRQNKKLSTILLYLKREFDIHICKRTLQRMMNRAGIRYQRHENPIDVVAALQAEQNTPRAHAGIRRMQLCLRTQHDLLVTRNEVRNYMHFLNPNGLQQNRRRRLRRRAFFSEGSNWVWHVDQHDKMREYGIRIHGCVDGFSRYIIWLKASIEISAQTIATYFYESIQEWNAIPCKIRADYGTENTVVAQVQIYLRRNDNDEYAYDRAVQFGSSQYNQPVENMWSRFIQQHEYFWIEQFKELKARGLWEHGDSIDRWCLLYIYMPLVRQGLEEYVMYHNSHRIRQQRNALRPGDVPEDMYLFPTNFGFREMKHLPDHADLAEVERQFNLGLPPSDYLPQPVKDVCDTFIQTNQINVTAMNAKDIYVQLRNYINANI